MHFCKELIQCKSVCDVKSGIDPLPFWLGREQKMLGFSQLWKPIKWQDLLEKRKKWPQCVLNRCKDSFSRKKYFGVRCTLKHVKKINTANEKMNNMKPNYNGKHSWFCTWFALAIIYDQHDVIWKLRLAGLTNVEPLLINCLKSFFSRLSLTIVSLWLQTEMYLCHWGCKQSVNFTWYSKWCDIVFWNITGKVLQFHPCKLLVWPACSVILWKYNKNCNGVIEIHIC